MRSFIRAAVVALAALAMIAPAHADKDNPKPMIRISGSAELQVTPDIVTFQTGVVSQGKTAREALDANSTAMNNVVDGLKALGIASKDLRTSNFSIQPKYNHKKDGSAPDIVGFEVRNTIAIAIREIDRVGEVLDRAATLGANQFGGLQFVVEGMDAKLDSARTEAMADARRKAELYAKAAGAELGPVISISERSSGASPRPNGAVVGMMSMRSAPPPIESGEATLSVSVNVVWKLKTDD